MIHDTLANVLSAIKNAEKGGKPAVVVKPVTKLAIVVLDVLKKEGYIGDYVVKKDSRGGNISVALIGKINDINSIKPRFSATVEEYEKFEKRYLPAKDFGRLIVSAPSGVMTHIDAKAKKSGGVLIAYVY